MRLVEFILASFPGHYSILGMRLVECVILLLQVHKQLELADNVSLKQFLEGIILGRVEAVGEETVTRAVVREGRGSKKGLRGGGGKGEERGRGERRGVEGGGRERRQGGREGMRVRWREEKSEEAIVTSVSLTLLQLLLVEVLFARLSASHVPRPSSSSPFSLYGSRHKWLDTMTPFDGELPPTFLSSHPFSPTATHT